MSRYVDEIEFLNALVKKRVYSSKTIGAALGEASTIDIVRCKECKQYKHYSSVFGESLECHLLCVKTKENDFCSYGERIEK